AERLERLVGDVLDLAKLDAHRFTVLREEVEMERLIDRAYVTFSEEARRRKIDYRCSVESKPVIVSDGDRVLQIISNLLSNAFRWTPDGGKIELELKAVDGTVCVAVDDSGPGIPAAERERIFRPFWSRDGGGTGLGLAIARELASALGSGSGCDRGRAHSRRLRHCGLARLGVARPARRLRRAAGRLQLRAQARGARGRARDRRPVRDPRRCRRRSGRRAHLAVAPALHGAARPLPGAG